MQEASDIEDIVQKMGLDCNGIDRLNKLIAEISSPYDHVISLFNSFSRGINDAIKGRSSPATAREHMNSSANDPLSVAILEYYRLGSIVGSYIFVSRPFPLTAEQLYLRVLRLVLEPIIGIEEAGRVEKIFQEATWGTVTH